MIASILMGALSYEHKCIMTQVHKYTFLFIKFELHTYAGDCISIFLRI